MASFKFLKSLSSNIYIHTHTHIWHLKIFPLYLLTCRVVEVLTIYKFLAYITQKKFHKLQKYKYLDCNVNVKLNL